MYFKIGDLYHLSEYYFEQMGGQRAHANPYSSACHSMLFRLDGIEAITVEINGKMPIHTAVKGNLTVKQIRLIFRCKSCNAEMRIDAHEGSFDYLAAIQILKIKEPWYQMFIPMGSSGKKNPNILFKMKKV